MSEEMRENGGIEQTIMTPSCPNGQLYTVKSGDTMFSIARRYHVSLQSLIDANPQIVDANIIRPGQVICIPVIGQVISCPGGQIYRVVRGDTMYDIARRNNISLDSLVRANPQIKNPGEIFPGQEICIPAASMGCPGGTLYTVVAGDTMFDIARRNNLSLSALVAANPQIINPDRIYPGQMICIPPVVPGEMPMLPPVLAAPTPQVPVFPPTMPMPLPAPAPSMPAPMPTVPTPAPLPRPTPVSPVSPLPMPCPTGYGQMPMCTMPVYVVVPWDECPYRQRNKRDRKGRRCR